MNNKEFQIVVLAKQVPDTHNVGKDAMKEDVKKSDFHIYLSWFRKDKEK